MTIIAALRESETSYLLGADTLEVDDLGINRHKLKLAKANGGMPLAWACDGNASVGQQFDRWMLQAIPSAISWDDLIPQARKQVATLNGEEWKVVVELARHSWEAKYGIRCLLLGWMKGVAGIWEINDLGQATPYLEEGFHALGTGALYAAVSYLTLKRGKGADALTKLRIMLDIATHHARDCGGRPDIWHITPQNIEEIEKGEHDDERNGETTKTAPNNEERV